MPLTVWQNKRRNERPLFIVNGRAVRYRHFAYLDYVPPRQSLGECHLHIDDVTWVAIGDPHAKQETSRNGRLIIRLSNMLQVEPIAPELLAALEEEKRLAHEVATSLLQNELRDLI